MQILSAEINTLADGLVFDRFCVNDTDFADEPPPDRLADVSRALIAAISQSSSSAPAFRRVWRPADERRSAALTPLPTRVHTDNSTSERFTIVDIFAADRMGLLYTITRTLFELGLSVSVAKIGTYLDQVVDVFYVTDHHGQKIEQEDRLHEIRTRLLEAVAELERNENEQAQQKCAGASEICPRSIRRAADAEPVAPPAASLPVGWRPLAWGDCPWEYCPAHGVAQHGLTPMGFELGERFAHQPLEPLAGPAQGCRLGNVFIHGLCAQQVQVLRQVLSHAPRIQVAPVRRFGVMRTSNQESLLIGFQQFFE